MIETRIEARRGCGYRKPGGIYLVSDGHGRYCGALPIELGICPTCKHGIKPARGWTWLNLADLVAERGCRKPDGCGDCPIADAKIQDVGLIWVGEKFYPNVMDFAKEAHHMGISRRISTLPRYFRLGETWVALAHRKAIIAPTAFGEEPKFKPGIFHVFQPARVEYVVKPDDPQEKLDKLEERGFTLVRVIPKEEQLQAAI